MDRITSGYFYKGKFKIQNFSFFAVLFLLNSLFSSLYGTVQPRLQLSEVHNPKIDSLRQLLKTAQNDTLKAKIYTALTEELYVTNIDTVIPLCLKAIQIADAGLEKAAAAEKKSFLVTKALALNNIGYVHKSQGDIPRALEWYHESIKIQYEIGDKKGIATSLNNIGLVYRIQGDIPKALELILKGLKIREELGNQDDIANSLNNIGSIYLEQEDIPMALEWYHKSLRIREQLGDKKGIGTTLSNIAYVYKKQAENEENPDSVRSKFNKALEWYFKSLKINEEIGDKQGIAISLNNLGSMHENKAKREQSPDSIADNLNKSLEWYDKSLKLREEIADKQGIANTLNNIGGIYFMQASVPLNASKSAEFLKKAEENCRRSLDIAKDLSYQGMILKASQTLAEIYKAMAKASYSSGSLAAAAGRYKQAVDMQELFKATSDRINNVEAQKLALKRQMQYEFEKKESAAKAKQDKKDALAKEEKQKQALIKNSLIIGFTFVLLLVLLIFKSYLQKQKANKELAEKNVTIEEQKQIVEEKNKHITSSIQYAKRIQYALLASDTFLKKQLPEHFVLYKPKDIVSGDFYWAAAIDDKLVMITADCTGHGVPGAFMSLLNISYLHEAIIEKKINSPEKILDYIRAQIINSLNPEGSEVESKDGMDAVLCIFDFKNLWLRFACANNPLWVLRNKEVIIFKPDKMPVGLHYGEQKPFSLNTLGLRKGDIVYTFTDGYADQFGGEKEKKFKYKQLQKLLAANADKPMEVQKEILNKTFESWKGSLEQVDDVLIIGIRV